MTDTSKEAAWDALMNYQQADEEGIMVLVSRQAIHECKDERDALHAQLQAARDEALKAVSARDALRRACGKIRKTCQKGGLSIGLRMTKMDDIARAALKSTSAEGEE